MSTRVCKKAFLAIYAISNGRLSRALSKMQSVGSPQTDQRGRHEPKNKTPEEDVQFVRAHIQSFSTESSHYCSKDNPNRRYLSSDLTIKKMYDLYLEKCKSESRTPVKENVYHEIFNTKFNLSFGSPKSDTCNRCDLLQTSLKTETD